MKIQVIRLNSSSYQEESFILKEKEALESIPGVKYCNNLFNIDPEAKYILITNTQTQPELIADNILKNTIMLMHPNSGYDNFSEEFIKSSPFPIIKGNMIRASAVTEYIIAAIFQHLCKVPHHSYWDESRSWNRKLLRDQEILILGHGTIGKMLNRTLSSLCRNVQVIDPYVIDETKRNLSQELSHKSFENKDILILACSLNADNENFIDAHYLKGLKSDGLIINAARGKLIAEEDLLAFLEKNSEAFAYLDVFQTEPFTPGTFAEQVNINKTSHIAGVYGNLNEDMINFERSLIEEFVNYIQKDKVQSFKSDFKEYCL